jgi:hypothetical protein
VHLLNVVESHCASGVFEYFRRYLQIFHNFRAPVGFMPLGISFLAYFYCSQGATVHGNGHTVASAGERTT